MPKQPPIYTPPRVNAPVHKPTYARQASRFLHTNSAQWRAIRKAQLERFPMCEDCRDQPAREADHHTNDTSQNRIGIDLSSLCKPCHSRRTAARQHGRETGIWGWDVNGWPLDPNHPWNKEKIAGG